MTNTLRYCIGSLLFSFAMLYAETPYAPEFSLHSHVLDEPPPLPQNYNTPLPDAWEYYAQKPTTENILLPEAPVLMEICAMTDKAVYSYPTKEALSEGCHRGDSGLLHFVLQPYQYWPMLTELRDIRLMPYNSPIQHTIEPKIVIFYKSSENALSFTTSIELGDIANQHDTIVINGNVFQYNQDIMQAFYGLIYQVSDAMFLQETSYTAQNAGYLPY